MNNYFKHFGFIMLLFMSFPFFAQNNAGSVYSISNSAAFSQGENLFRENKASEAVEVLEYEILNGQISGNTYNFLGLGYYQLGDFEKSIDAFKRGIKAQPENKKVLSYNLGNSYYAVKNYQSAIECYSDALRSDSLFYEAILNRANALLMSDRLLSAKEDYQLYIKKRPDDVQRERIELLIKALEQELAQREEDARLLAEQNKARWEEVDGQLANGKNEKYKADWEKFNDENDVEFFDDSANTVVTKENSSNDNAKWESVAKEEAPVYKESKEVEIEKVGNQESWESLSENEVDEIKKLEEQSRREREKWLADQKRQEEERAALEREIKRQIKQQSLDNEKRIREQLVEDMMKADEERRKKLLEEVANSLQSTDSTNQTSGAEDLLEYDLEGELD